MQDDGEAVDVAFLGAVCNDRQSRGACPLFFHQLRCRPQQRCTQKLQDGILSTRNIYHYLRQVNEVNGGDNAFVRCVSVCVSVRSGRSWELNANSSKTVKATDLKFDKSVPEAVRT